jgi:hypothetical protein
MSLYLEVCRQESHVSASIYCQYDSSLMMPMRYMTSISIDQHIYQTMCPKYSFQRKDLFSVDIVYWEALQEPRAP